MSSSYFERLATFKRPLRRDKPVFVSLLVYKNGSFQLSERYAIPYKSSPYNALIKNNGDMIEILKRKDTVICSMVDNSKRSYYVIPGLNSIPIMPPPGLRSYLKMDTKVTKSIRKMMISRMNPDKNISIVGLSYLKLRYFKEGTSSRAGIIPYARVGSALYLCFGKSIDGRLCDFGGRQKGRGNTPYVCMRRELREEMGKTNKNIIMKSVDSNRGTICYEARTSTEGMTHVILTEIDMEDLESHKKNYEVLDYKFFDFSILSTIPDEMIHPPIYHFFKYITQKNDLIGYPDSLISTTESRTFDSLMRYV